MKIRTLDHAALPVSDVERSRHFYGQLLGLEEVARPATFDFPGAWFRMGNTELHLIGDPEPGQTEPSSHYRDELAGGHCSHLPSRQSEVVMYAHALEISSWLTNAAQGHSPDKEALEYQEKHDHGQDGH